MKTDRRSGQLSSWSVELPVYWLLNARIRGVASHYAIELQKTYDLRRIVLLNALSRSRERNRGGKIFYRISDLSFFQSSNF